MGEEETYAIMKKKKIYYPICLNQYISYFHN